MAPKSLLSRMPKRPKGFNTTARSGERSLEASAIGSLSGNWSTAMQWSPFPFAERGFGLYPFSKLPP